MIIKIIYVVLRVILEGHRRLWARLQPQSPYALFSFKFGDGNRFGSKFSPIRRPIELQIHQFRIDNSYGESHRRRCKNGWDHSANHRPFASLPPHRPLYAQSIYFYFFRYYLLSTLISSNLSRLLTLSINWSFTVLTYFFIYLMNCCLHWLAWFTTRHNLDD